MLRFAYELAEQLGETDPYKILSLPASTLLGWQAHFALKNEPSVTFHPEDTQQPNNTPVRSSLDEECAAVMRMLG